MERTLPSVIHQGELVDANRLTRILFGSNKNYGGYSPLLWFVLVVLCRLRLTIFLFDSNKNYGEHSLLISYQNFFY